MQRNGVERAGGTEKVLPMMSTRRETSFYCRHVILNSPFRSSGASSNTDNV